MRAIDHIQSAYRNFPLRDRFVEVERQILREGTVAQISLRSDSLGLMIKLFVSEMEGEGQLYIAPLGTNLGYREEGGWQYWWPIEQKIASSPTYNKSSISRLRSMNPLVATCDVQLQAKLEWLVANLPLIVKYLN